MTPWWRRAWRRLLVLALIRRVTPGPYERWPGPFDGSEDGNHDTGGGGWYRPAHRKQDPSVDPAEPGGGESSSRGSDHGWSNCTLASGAMALEFHTEGRLAKWGGHLRHHAGGNTDMEGGTDLYDLRDAWASYGETFTIRSGSGWSKLKEDRADGRFLVVQGTGNVPGSATFDGGHACALGPETNADGEWLWGDPLAGGWQWVAPSAIRDWMERWASGLAYGMSAAHPPKAPAPDPEPTPEPAPCPELPDVGPMLADAQARGYADAMDAVFRSWYGPDPDPDAPRWALGAWDGGEWSVPWPLPLAQVVAASWDATWDPSAWTAALWDHGNDPAPPPAVPWDAMAWAAPWA